MGSINKRISALLLALVALSAGAHRAQEPPDLAEITIKAVNTGGKRPIVIIPGILGSELVNRHSGEKVWFSLRRSKDDDLKLPVSRNLARSKDNLIPGDVLRSVKFLFARRDFYGGLAKSLQENGGYSEASMENPPESLRDKFFLFPYDWRRDNVETARLLLQRLGALKRATGEKDVKFDIVSHSMGGLIARYAAMYGNRELPAGRPKPNWAGAALIHQIHMFGTPNHGSADSLQVLLEGFGAVPGINLPFVRDLSPFEVFTMPALFQLLPHTDTELFYDENLNPLKVDIYDYRTWEKYGWSIYGDEGHFKRFTDGEVARHEIYLVQVLKRSKQFHRALDAKRNGPVKIVSFASDCSDTLDGYVLLQKDQRKWKTLMRAVSFKNSSGEEIPASRVRERIIKPGDGRVAKRSAISGLPPATPTFVACEKHDSLLTNDTLQRHLFNTLIKGNAMPVMASKK